MVRPRVPPSLPRRLLQTRSYSALKVRDTDRVRWLTLNRPEKLNALTLPDLGEFQSAVEDANADPSIRAIAVTGEGRAFCAGMDTHVFAGLSVPEALDVIRRVSGAVGALRLSPKPTAVALNGYCIGAAFEMALSADFRTSFPGVMAGLPETKVGIPSVVDAALLPQYTGLSLAKEMLLTGDLYPVEQVGFVNRFAERKDGELERVTMQLLEKVTGLTPTVMKAQKELNEFWLNNGIKESIAHSIDVFGECFQHPETKEAVDKYNARRKK